MPRDWVTNIFPRHLSEWVSKQPCLIFHWITIIKGPVLPMFVAVHCLLKSLCASPPSRVTASLWHVQGRRYFLHVPDEGIGSESEVQCLVQDHKWQMAELGFKPSVSERKLFYDTVVSKCQRTTEKRALSTFGGSGKVPWRREDLNWD